MRVLCLIASALVASSAFAQTPGSCEWGRAQAVLDVSDVQASLFINGGFFYDTTTLGEGYVVPKTSGSSPLYGTALWIAGKIGDEVRASFSRWGGQMWPGPLDDGGILPNPDDCSAYDRIWTVSTYDVAIYEQTGAASSDLAEWPIGLGAPGVDANGQPVVVTSREQTLELATGERPVISGTQTAFWVMNDVGNVHREYDPDLEQQITVPPLGVEVAVSAFSVVSEEAALHQGTFYQYTVTNRNTQPLTDAHLGFWTDPDLGILGDDYMGVDTTRGLAFIYNQTETDGVYGTPPAFGFDLLDSLWTATYVYDDLYLDYVRSRDEAHNRLRGLSNDGGLICEGGWYGQCADGLPVTRYTHAGDPLTESFWSALNIDGDGTNENSYDQIIILGSPQFDLQPGESKTFGLALLFAQGIDYLDSITELRAASDRVQAAYDDGSLFETTASTPLLATPSPIGPTSDIVRSDSALTFEWTAAPDAQRYRLEVSRSDSFADTTAYIVASSKTEIHLPDEIVGNEPVTYHWRIRAESDTRRSPWSAPRTFTYYRYIGRPLTLADGVPAFVEIAGPDRADPCAPGVRSPDGCDEVAGNLVSGSLNSTGEYYLNRRYSGSDYSLARFAPNDFEIRFTEAGGLGFFRGDSTLIRVPFEIWDIGMVRPGEVNDLEDDVRLIPTLWDINSDSPPDSSDACAFNPDQVTPPYNTLEVDGYVESDWVYGYFPTTTYADFETAYLDLVNAAPGQCYTASRTAVNAFIDFDRGAPIRSEAFGSSSDAPTLPQTGTVIRFYTTDPFVVADEQAPAQSRDLTLGPAYPNPSTSSLTVPYALTTTGEIELAVYDVLGRRVTELVNARQLEGTHTAELDASALAPGVYVVQLRAGEETRTTRITVVR